MLFEYYNICLFSLDDIAPTAFNKIIPTSDD